MRDLEPLIDEAVSSIKPELQVFSMIPDLLFLPVPVGSHVVEIFPAIDRLLSQVCLQCIPK